MKVPLHIVEARRQQLAALLQRSGYLPLQEICRELGVSESTARRDLRTLAGRNEIVRTFGGAVSEYNQRFTSFRDRQEISRSAKQRIARKARTLVEVGMTLYLDAGTTVAALAEELKEKPVTDLRVVTNSFPIAEILASLPNGSVHIAGGQFLRRQSVLLGPSACRAIAFYKIDLAFMSAESADSEGIWNSHKEIAQLQNAVLKKSSHHVFCLDPAKIGSTAPVVLVGWDQVEMLISNLTWQGISKRLPLKRSQYLQA